VTGNRLTECSTAIHPTVAGMKTPSIAQSGLKLGHAKIPIGCKISASSCAALTKTTVANRKSAIHLQKTCKVIVSTLARPWVVATTRPLEEWASTVVNLVVTALAQLRSPLNQ